MYYFDWAATSIKKPKQVTDAVVWAMNNLGNAGRGAHEASISAMRELLLAREKIAKFFGCEDPLKVVFTKNATEALNTVISGLFSDKDSVITTHFEHNSVLRPLYLFEEKGLEISFIEADSNGQLIYENLESLLKKNTKALICNHASNVTGDIVDLKTISKFCSNNNLIFILDASQTAGVIPINMKEMGIDILCFTGHKSLLGPQGTGGICFNSDIFVRPLIVGGSGQNSFDKEQPHGLPERLEAGTLNSHGIAGLSASIDYINNIGIGKIYEHENFLMKEFYLGINNLRNIKIYGDFSKKIRAPIVSFNIEGVSSADLSDELFGTYNIITRSGAHCAPLIHKALKTEKHGLTRFSFSNYNTIDEVLYAVDSIKNICNNL